MADIVVTVREPRTETKVGYDVLNALRENAHVLVFAVGTPENVVTALTKQKQYADGFVLRANVATPRVKSNVAGTLKKFKMPKVKPGTIIVPDQSGDDIVYGATYRRPENFAPKS